MTKRNIGRTTYPSLVYPQWDTNSSPLPPRSRLFRLPPVGIGTIGVESLTSYIARLAAEHCVSPRQLLCKEVLTEVGRTSPSYSSSPLFSANTINGIGNLTEVTVNGFEKLTLRDDLRYTTFLPWKGAVSFLQLLRTRRAWCPSCYEEQIIERGYAYEPLIWAVEIVSICYRHHEQLCHVCPHCGNQLIFLATHYRPGYCSKCLKWLGDSNIGSANKYKPKPLTSIELARQIAFLDIVGELLSRAPSITSQPAQQTFLNNLTGIIERDANGSINLFSDLAGVWSGKIRKLLAGLIKLSIEALCHLCARLNLSPVDVLCEKEEGAWPENCAPAPCKDEPNEKLPTAWEEVEDKLQAALGESPPPSIEAMARRLGYYPARLKGNFPDVCAQITSRYKSYVRSTHPTSRLVIKTLRSAMKEQPPPSLQSVFRRLGCKDTGYYYYSNYFDLCTAIAQRYKEFRNKPFDKKITEKQLKAALTEDPAPSFSSVAKRLGHKRDFFRQKYPEIARAIASRHMQYRRNQRKERAVELRDMIRAAIKSILAYGKYVSEARAKEYLQQHKFRLGRDSLFKQALREIKSEMGI
jgi:transcriptional regulator with XRE-family HTH domain